MTALRTSKLFGMATLASLAYATAAWAQTAATTAAPAAAAAAPAAAAAAPAAAAAAPAAAAAAPAAATAVSALNTGDTAWMLTSTALVLMMTIPGLGLFYAGMVRKKNVLATLMQAFAITCIVTVLWYIIGYSAAFTNDDPANPGKFIGSFAHFLLNGVNVTTTNSLAPTIPEYVFSMFQMTFAIITPALIAGAFAERMKFSALIIFMSLWLLFVYTPIAHWVWGGGFLGALGVLDFAGGTVVHINAGRRGPRLRPGARQAQGFRHRQHGAA